MSCHFRSLVVWGSRLIGIAVSLFISFFALGSFDGRPFEQALPDFARHLIPSALVAIVVAVGWRFPWVGAAAFAAFSAAYAASVPHRPDWILVISGPLAVTAVLFALAGLLGRSDASPSRRSS